MGVFGPLMNATSSGGFPPRDPVIAGFLGLGNQTESGANVTPDTATQSTAVLSALRLLTETVASLPLILYKRVGDNGKERDAKNPLWNLLKNRPNKWQTPFQYWEMVGGHRILRGNAFSQIVSNGRGVITDLIPLHPDRVRPFLAPDGKIAYAYQPKSGELRVFLQEEIFRLGGLSEDGTKSKSLVELGMEAIGVTLSGDAFAGRFFKNDGRPSGVLKHPTAFKDPLTPDGDFARFRQSWQEAQAGRNHGKTAILEGGMEYQTIGFANKDAQLLESRQFQIAEIARIFRVPPHLIYDLIKSSFNNIEAQGRDFVSYSLRTWMVQYEQDVYRDLFTSTMRKDDQFVEFLAEALLRGDLKARNESYAIGRQWGWYSANDVLKLENQNPLPGEDGNQYLVPMNMTTPDKIGSSEDSGDSSTDTNDTDTQAINNKLMANAARYLATKEGNFVSRSRNTLQGEALKTKLSSWYSNYKKLISATLVVNEENISDEMIDKFLISAYNHGVNVDLRVDELLNFVQNLNKTGVKDES